MRGAVSMALAYNKVKLIPTECLLLFWIDSNSPYPAVHECWSYASER